MPVTNQHLQQQLQALETRVDGVDDRIERIETRMQSHEDEEKENTKILKRIEVTINGYEKAIKTVASLLKYLLGIIALAFASVLAYWAMGMLHIHP